MSLDTNFLKAIQRIEGNEIAPAWFAGAMVTALLPIHALLDGIDSRLDGTARFNGIYTSVGGINGALIRLEAITYNSSAYLSTDVLVAPIIPPAVAAPAGFPGTIQELENISMANCNACMDAFGLVLPAGVQKTISNKRRLLARFLGVRVE